MNVLITLKTIFLYTENLFYLKGFGTECTLYDYHEKKLDNHDFNWKLIYRIPCIAAYETKVCIFQYKLLHNVLYLNKKLFYFGIPYVNYMMKHRGIFFMNVLIRKIYGTNFDYIFQEKLHYQF